MQTPRFIPHYLTAESFQKWLETLDDDNKDMVLLFCAKTVVSVGLPNDMTLTQLRGWIRAIYSNQPNPTWDQFVKEMAEKP